MSITAALPIDDLLLGFGDFLLKKGVVTQGEIAEAEQIRSEAPYLRLGEILLGLGHLKLLDYMSLLREHLGSLRLGDYLVMRRIVTRDQLNEGLALQQESGKMLGYCLIQLGHCTMPVMQQLLAEQRRLRGEPEDEG
ncbi:MAG: hypothetical protein FJZ00_00275 [Candidatus Sericytochromatia bacterium]|uniref:Type II secretion system protein GspE N-terminal domain-containing protein n=1 Tax=Candidatus Tanganyikabacteria bacterium TaxID=2961651 RepID=A0A937X3K7_9BACT|nr:hypothetical protein [Candidatus Tanganyikabacteria bacterium]